MAMWAEVDKLGEPRGSRAGSKAAARPVPLRFGCHQARGIAAPTATNTQTQTQLATSAWITFNKSREKQRVVGSLGCKEEETEAKPSAGTVVIIASAQGPAQLISALSIKLIIIKCDG